MPPYPVNVTAQMLDCFSEKYDLPEKKVTDVDELPIGYIAEELWIYSKSVELLTEPEDACYLAAQTQDIQLNITEMLCLLKNKLPVKDVDWLIEIVITYFQEKNLMTLCSIMLLNISYRKRLNSKIVVA